MSWQQAIEITSILLCDIKFFSKKKKTPRFTQKPQWTKQCKVRWIRYHFQCFCIYISVLYTCSLFCGFLIICLVFCYLLDWLFCYYLLRCIHSNERVREWEWNKKATKRMNEKKKNSRVWYFVMRCQSVMVCL